MADLSVRHLLPGDFERIVDYFLNGDKDFLLGMGVDSSKLPERGDWLELLSKEYQQPLERKTFFYVIWLLENVPVGHSNINKIVFGEEAYMHLHLWDGDNRKKGIGLELVKKSVPIYFDYFKLKKLYCEPYALNIAPNKILEKTGFDLIKTYETIPGWISFHQPVNRWCMERDRYHALFS